MIITLRVLGSLVVLFTMNVTMVLVVDTNPPSPWRVALESTGGTERAGPPRGVSRDLGEVTA